MGTEKICYGDNVVVEGHKLSLSLAVEAGDFVFVSGLVSADENMNLALDVGIAEQTANTLELIKRVLAQAGCELNDIVRMGVFLKNREDLEGYNNTVAKYFPEKPPARITVLGDFLLEKVLVEIEVTAYKPKD